MLAPLCTFFQPKKRFASLRLEFEVWQLRSWENRQIQLSSKQSEIFLEEFENLEELHFEDLHFEELHFEDLHLEDLHLKDLRHKGTHVEDLHLEDLRREGARIEDLHIEGMHFEDLH